VIRSDSGVKRPGTRFAETVFRKWQGQYDGSYVASEAEPLVQIADFLAFSINRCTHLQLKSGRTETDLWFLGLIGEMQIRSADLKRGDLPEDFTTAEIDAMHAEDRRAKGLE
jgi:hypothetical protein